MAQYQNFSFEPPSRLEAVAQHADEKQGGCHHRPGSCSDSVMAATPADRVFGSDSSPQRVLETHSSDQIAHLFAHPRSAPGRTGLPSPVGSKTHSMPTHDGLGFDDGYDVKKARTATIEPDEQRAVCPTQMQSP